jgi:hypothetical protein
MAAELRAAASSNTSLRERNINVETSKSSGEQAFSGHRLPDRNSRRNELQRRFERLVVSTCACASGAERMFAIRTREPG